MTENFKELGLTSIEKASLLALVVIMGGFVVNFAIVAIAATDIHIGEVEIADKGLYYNSNGFLVQYIRGVDGWEYVVPEEDYNRMQIGEKYMVNYIEFYSSFWMWSDKIRIMGNVLNESIEMRI